MRNLKNQIQKISLASASLVMMAFTQNCAPVSNLAFEDTLASVTDDTGQRVRPNYAVTSLSSNEPPPLKIIFVTDNSNSMSLNQLNLQKSISAMFDGQSKNISEFNSELYFITTAQLPSLGGGFPTTTRAPASLGASSPSTLTNTYRDPNHFSGLIAGDLLGFQTSYSKVDNLETYQYLPQSTVGFVASGSGSQVAQSVSYAKGESIDSLKTKVSDRLAVISPELASSISNPDVFPALDQSSGMCAVARILKNPSGYFKKGDVVSFVMISDGNDFDSSGSRCSDGLQKEYLYQASCVQRVPASTKNQTTVKYMTTATPASVKTNFSVTAQDQTKNKVDSSATLSKAAKNAVCNGTQEREFSVNYEVLTKSFYITYNKRAVIGTREGNVPVYGDTQSGLKTSNQSGVLASDCSTNVSKLRTILNDQSSDLTITSCTQNADTKTATTKALTYSAFASVDLSSSTSCSSAVLSNISSSGTIAIGACALAAKSESITAANLTSAGFTASSSAADCQAAVAKICSTSNNSLRSCKFVSHAAQVIADSRGPVVSTNNTNMSCNATCATFPGLCSADNSTTLASFASANGYTCGMTYKNSAETYTATSSAVAVSVTAPALLSCSSTCSEASAACSGDTSASKTVASYNKACSVTSSSNNAAVPSVAKDLGTVDDSSAAISCSTVCNSSNGLCSGTQTINSYITSTLKGQSCSEVRGSVAVAAYDKTQTVTKLKKSQVEAGTYCPAGFSTSGAATLTSEFIATTSLVAGTSDLKSYITSQLTSAIGASAATLSAFITPKGKDVPEKAIAWGQAYEDLVKTWGRGNVNDISSSSYSPALEQLSATLHDQLIRTVTFPAIPSNMRIRKVYVQPSSQPGVETELADNMWSASGTSVTLDISVAVDAADQIKIQYY